MAGSKLHFIGLFSFMLSCSLLASASAASLKVGFYAQTCPSAETIVRKAVNEAVSRYPAMAAGLIRMHFHDCFVRGCDASVLLKSLPGNPPAERDHPANNPSLRGFEVIDEAKASIEALCPGTVSCADIIAFAARDSAYTAGGIYYAVPSGRRDGRVSLSDEVLPNLPTPFFNATQLAQTFARKGMSVDEMVTLSGAHSIGVAHCTSFSNRLYSFNATHPQDPSLDPNYAAFLKTRCPPPPPAGAVGDVTTTVLLDVVTPYRLDNKYYSELRHRRGLLTSDQTLMDSASTSRMVLHNKRNGAGWSRKFARAMVHMGSLDVLTGHQGSVLVNVIAATYITEKILPVLIAFVPVNNDASLDRSNVVVREFSPVNVNLHAIVEDVNFQSLQISTSSSKLNKSTGKVLGSLGSLVPTISSWC
ncbi:hypothetical protein V6N11_000918 [Hibiscus sabdariffa]|uniref:Peroxidase n=1 Tax=Hibiscus sabdariffa TaxID=183260 RepID=A0ABR2RY64_9ROSI